MTSKNQLPTITNRTDPWLWVIFLTAFLVRLIYLVQFLRSPLAGYLRADQNYYVQWALEIASGHWLGKDVFEQAPLYPYLLGVGFRLFGPQFWIALLAQLLVGVSGCLLLSSCGRRLFGRTTGVVAGLIAAVYGPCVFYEGMLLKSFLSPFLTTLALYATLRYRDELSTRWLWLAGAAVGAACLERENHILLLLPIFVWVCAPQDSNPLPALARFGLMFRVAAATGLILVPSTLHNLAVGGQFVVVTSGGGEAFYIAHGPGAKGFYSAPSFVTGNPYLEHEDFRREAERRTGRKLSRSEASRFWFVEAIRSILANPLRTLRITRDKGLILLNDYEVPDGENYDVSRRFISLLQVLPTFGWIGALGLVGLAIAWSTNRSAWIVIAFAATHFGGVLLFYNFGRFRLGMMPPWILLAAVTVTWLLSSRPKVSRHAWMPKLVAGLTIASVSVVIFRPPLGALPPGHLASQEIATAHLSSLTGDFLRAETAYCRVLAIYTGYDPQVPKISRILTQAHLGLAGLYGERGELDVALRHVDAARKLPNRTDFQRIVLQQRLELLESAVAQSMTLEGIPKPESELEGTRRLLTALESGGTIPTDRHE